MYVQSSGNGDQVALTVHRITVDDWNFPVEYPALQVMLATVGWETSVVLTTPREMFNGGHLTAVNKNNNIHSSMRWVWKDFMAIINMPVFLYQVIARNMNLLSDLLHCNSSKSKESVRSALFSLNFLSKTPLLAKTLLITCEHIIASWAIDVIQGMH